MSRADIWTWSDREVPITANTVPNRTRRRLERLMVEAKRPARTRVWHRWRQACQAVVHECWTLHHSKALAWDSLMCPARILVKSAFFRNSPSSRSESAMLSAESSKCICDWMAAGRSFQIPPLLQWYKLGDHLLLILPVHQIIDMDLQNNLRSSTRSQVLWAHNLWELLCAGFRHSAVFDARVTLDGVTRSTGWPWRCSGCTRVFLLCGRISRWRRGNVHGERCVREQPRMTHQMTTSFWAHKDAMQIALVLSQAHWLCGARCGQPELHNCALWVGVRVYTSRRFSGIPSRKPNEPERHRHHHQLSDDVECQWELQLVCHCESCHCDVEDEDADDGCPVALCCAAIQFSDRHSSQVLRESICWMICALSLCSRWLFVRQPTLATKDFQLWHDSVCHWKSKFSPPSNGWSFRWRCWCSGRIGQ